MTFEITPALVGLAGVIVGGAIQASVQLFLARRNHSLAQKSQAYLTYFQGLSAAGYAQTDEERATARSLLAEGQGLVALYGSDEAVAALSAVRRNDVVLNDSHKVLMSKAIKAMREDVLGSKTSLDGRSLYGVMFIDEEIEK